MYISKISFQRERGKKSKSGEISFSTFDFIFAYFSTTIESLLFTGAVCRPRFISRGEFYIRLSAVKLVLIDVSLGLVYYWSPREGRESSTFEKYSNQKNVKQRERSWSSALWIETLACNNCFVSIAALNGTDVNCVRWEEFSFGKKKF